MTRGDERHAANEIPRDCARAPIRPFTATYQAAVRQLILTSLGEHFGSVDESLNPDLDDIAGSYVALGHVFVVAELGNELVGTGALIEAGAGVGRLVRMSVSARHRQRGIGRALVGYLVEVARRRGYRRVVIETNDDWADAIGLYLAYGFAEVGRGGGEVHLARDQLGQLGQHGPRDQPGEVGQVGGSASHERPSPGDTPL